MSTATMARSIGRRQSLRTVLLLLAACVLTPRIAQARPLHVSSSMPSAEATIHGRHVEYVIGFDGLVNHAASHLAVTQAGHVVQRLTPRLGSAVNVLCASGIVPPPGSYMLHWEAISPDGEVSTGDIPFTVAP